MQFIDTHAHLDGAEFDADRDEVVARAQAAGVCRVFVPAIDLKSARAALALTERYPGFAYPMIGLHPEEVRDDWEDVLAAMRAMDDDRYIAIGEVGLDFYWSRDYENEQMAAFERQVEWAVERRKPLMIHCRKAQNEMVRLLRRYAGSLAGGVFHCFTGNLHEAEELLAFDGFALGIGGVLTFKKSRLPEVVAEVPLNRIVLETDAPYMAPVPMRGQRNESAFVRYVLERIAECHGVDCDTVAQETNATAERIFGIGARNATPGE